MSKPHSSAYNRPLLFGFWALIVAVFIVRALYNASHVPLLWDSDDAMRLTVVRDFMAGQNWFDHTQYRIDVPHGAMIHWSRLIDLPISLLIRFFALFTPANAETLAVSAWPLLLLLGLLYLSSKLAVTLNGPGGQLPGLALPVFALPIMVEFAPGRIDHHSVQILLTLALALSTILARTRPRLALWAGIAAASSLAVGTAGIVFIAAAIVAFGLMWAADATQGRTLRAFGIAFALATLVHFLLFLPPSQYLAPNIDVLSIVYVSAAFGTGLAFVLLPTLPLAAGNWRGRLAAGIFAGGLLLGALIWAFPGILAGPYGALDPWLKTHWLDRITEAKPVWTSFAATPAYTASIVLPPLFAIAVTVWRLARGPAEGRADWAVYLLFLVFAFAEMVLQVRGARLAAAMAVPAGAYAILAARNVYLARRSALRVAVLILAWLGFSGIPLMIAGNLLMPAQRLKAEEKAGLLKADCLMPGAFAPLKTFAPQPVMAPIDLGSHLLLYTKLSVVGAPYHRNQQGILDTYRFLNGPAAQAKAILAEHGIKLVVTCSALPEMKGLADAAPDSVVRTLQKGDVPGFLTEITPTGDGALRLFRVSG